MTLRAADILIIGTMKGGTTNLWANMRRHPNIIMGSTKELHYFTLKFDRPVSWYIEQFPDRPDDVFAIDASPTYFDMAKDKKIPQRIKNTIPNTNLILCVRDPIERSISHYYQLQKSKNTGKYFKSLSLNEFFDQALNMSWDKKNPFAYHFRCAIEFSKYSEKFRNYNEVFGPGKLLVLNNDDIINDQRRAMAQVFAHCGMDELPDSVELTGPYPLRRRASELDRGILRELQDLLVAPYADFQKMLSYKAI